VTHNVLNLGTDDDPILVNSSSTLAFDVARGAYPGSRTRFFIGHNDDVGISSSPEDVWNNGGTISWATQAEKMNIVSSSTDDDDGGTGARTFKIFGLDKDFKWLEDTVTLNGDTNVLTENEFLRVNCMRVITAGNAKHNVGQISATQETSGILMGIVAATESACHDGRFTVPAGMTGFIAKFEFNCAKLAGGGKPRVVFEGYVRNNHNNPDAPWTQEFEKVCDTDTANFFDVEPAVFFALQEKADLKITASTDVNNTDVRVRGYFIMLPNTALSPLTT